MKKILCSFFLILFLFGCMSASINNDRGLNALSNGNFATAAQYFKACLSESGGFDVQGTCANNLGVVYWKIGDKDRAINAWMYAARNDSPEARTNLLTLAGISPPPVDPAILYQRQRAVDALGEAAYNVGGYIGGGNRDGYYNQGPSVGFRNPDGTQDSFNLRTGEKAIQYRNPDGSYDTFRFGGRR